jgi:hypothetical protein
LTFGNLIVPKSGGVLQLLPFQESRYRLLPYADAQQRRDVQHGRLAGPEGMFDSVMALIS